MNLFIKFFKLVITTFFALPTWFIALLVVFFICVFFICFSLINKDLEKRFRNNKTELPIELKSNYTAIFITN